LLVGESGMRGPLPIATNIAPPSVIDAQAKPGVDRAIVANRAVSAEAHPELSGRPGTKPAGRPSRHATRRSAGATSASEVSNPPSAPVRAEKPGAAPPTFDPDNPYR
jgi:hypothetical protein